MRNVLNGECGTPNRVALEVTPGVSHSGKMVLFLVPDVIVHRPDHLAHVDLHLQDGPFEGLAIEDLGRISVDASDP